MKLHSINHEQRLYVMPCGHGGYSCYGFDVLDRKARAVAEWLGCAAPTSGPGTADHFAQCDAIMDYGARHSASTGKRCPAELTPQLTGLEGQRVEVISADGSTRRFYVGKSTGWAPCHLEIKTRRSMGGGRAVYLSPGDRVRVVQPRALRAR